MRHLDEVEERSGSERLNTPEGYSLCRILEVTLSALSRSLQQTHPFFEIASPAKRSQHNWQLSKPHARSRFSSYCCMFISQNYAVRKQKSYGSMKRQVEARRALCEKLKLGGGWNHYRSGD